MDTTTRQQQTFYLDDEIKRGKYSSTMYELYKNHCPKALNFSESGVSEDTRKYQRGNTAHFILENVGKANAVDPEYQKTIAEKTVEKLTSEGYYYFDRKQPPFDCDLAIEGKDVALAWLSRNSLPFNAQYENVFAMDANGNAVSFEDPRCRWRAKIDVFWIKTEDVSEEAELRIGVTNDYKSAWGAGKNWLESWQCKSQMILIWVNHPELDGVCAEVINLRTGSVNSQTIYFDDEGVALLSKWRDEILSICNTMDRNREAQPGAGCDGCPFFAHCDAAKEVRAAKENAAAYAVIEQERAELKSIIRAQLEDADGIACNGGFIGYDLKPKTVMRPEHTTQIVASWWRVPLEDAALMTKETSFVRALGLGASNLDSFMDATLSDASPTERQEFFDLCATKEFRAEFGVHKIKNGNGHANLNLLPADTKLKSRKNAKPSPKKRKTKKSQRKKRDKKKSSEKKTAKRKATKRKSAKAVKGKGNKIKATVKKPKTRKKGRKARK